VPALSDILTVLGAGFLMTLAIVCLTAALALPAGTVLAVMRVSPVRTLRAVGAVYVGIVRNIPLPVLLYFTVLVLPQLGIVASFFAMACMSLAAYYAAFVCEAVRSGINAVPIGQAEAARSIGLSHGQVLRMVVVPQALRSVVPPLVSLFIQLVRSSAVAGAFGVAELFAGMGVLVFRHPDTVISVLLITGFAYLLLTIPSGLLLGLLEKRTAVAR
jgi:glutamate transport system permease protein